MSSDPTLAREDGDHELEERAEMLVPHLRLLDERLDVVRPLVFGKWVTAFDDLGRHIVEHVLPQCRVGVNLAQTACSIDERDIARRAVAESHERVAAAIERAEEILFGIVQSRANASA